MDVETVVAELRALGDEPTKRTLMRHGAREPLFGVKVGDLKPIVRRIKRDHTLALALYSTGNSDAMYLAGLIADDPRMTAEDLQRWVEGAYWSLLYGSTVPWVAAESGCGWEMGQRWIEDAVETIACAGWSTLSSLVGITPDAQLDLPALERLLERVERTIHTERNGVRSSMNGFVICVGGYVAPLTDRALQAADAISGVRVDTGNTECKIPSARAYIEKMQARGVIGKKRKTAKC